MWFFVTTFVSLLPLCDNVCESPPAFFLLFENGTAICLAGGRDCWQIQNSFRRRQQPPHNDGQDASSWPSLCGGCCRGDVLAIIVTATSWPSLYEPRRDESWPSLFRDEPQYPSTIWSCAKFHSWLYSSFERKREHFPQRASSHRHVGYNAVVVWGHDAPVAQARDAGSGCDEVLLLRCCSLSLQIWIVSKQVQHVTDSALVSPTALCWPSGWWQPLCVATRAGPFWRLSSPPTSGPRR